FGRDPGRERELMPAQQRQRMHERVDRTEGPPVRRVETHDDARDRARAEAHANEMARLEREALGHGVGEGARGSANACEDRDLSGSRGHTSYLRSASLNSGDL